MGELITFLDADMKEPQLYGWFHILSLGITALSTFLICFFFKAPTEKTVRRILFFVSLAVILLEIYKQFNFSFSYENEKVTFDYQWYAFPFQFCSTPMYVGMIAAWIKNEKIHKALCAYLATFSLFAGTAVMFYPETVFISTIGINIQTMVCHGSMIVLGIFLYVSGYVKAENKTILKAIPIFAVAVLSASVMNEIAYISGILKNEEFNMFFISRHGEPSLPVFSMLQPYLPFPIEIIVYILGFSAASYIMLFIAMSLKKAFAFMRNSKGGNQSKAQLKA